MSRSPENLESLMALGPPAARSRGARAQANRSVSMWLGIAAIAGLLGIVIYRSASSSSKADSYQDLHILCPTCNQEFTISAEDAARERARAGNPRKKLTCPICKKETGETMTRCGKCNQWYLPKNNDVPGQRACTKCGHDPDKG